MTRKTKIILPIGVVLLGAALALAILKARPEVDRQETAALPPLVRVVKVEQEDLALTVLSQGTVKPQVESTLVAEVAGRIDWVSPAFAEGGFFERGSKLVQIDDRDYHLAVSQAEAQVAQARVRLELEQAESDLAREEWNDLGEGEASPLALREPQLTEARAAVQAAEATLQKTKLELERTSIRAQFAGRLRSKLVDLGQFVNRGTALATVYSTDTAELRLPVPKDQLAFLDLQAGLHLAESNPGGPEVILRGEIGSASYSWQAHIVRTGSEFDPATRMFPLFAQIDDPFGRNQGAEGPPLPMGLFVNAEIAGRVAYGITVLPRSVLRGSHQVLVVDDESRLRFREVEILRTQGDEVLVQSGLEVGEWVCISSLESVVDGMRVRTIVEGDLLGTEADKEEVS